jgi:carbamate kinase
MSTLKKQNKFNNKTQIFNLPLSTHSENTNSIFWIAIKPVVTEHTRYIEVDTRRNYKKKGVTCVLLGIQTRRRVIPIPHPIRIVQADHS